MRKRFFSLTVALLAALVLALTVSAYDPALPRVIDETGTLTAAQTGKLNEASGAFRERYGIDCVILLTDSLRGDTPRDYADDYYDEHGYGMGADNSGILFLVSIRDREAYISTCGGAIDAITDYEIDLILDDAVEYFGHGDWYGGFAAAVAAAGRMIERPNYGDSGHRDGIALRDRLLIVFIAPTVIAFVAVAVMCAMMNNARGKHTAADYTVRGSFSLTGALDILISRHVSRVPKNTDNGGHGGGSSHISHSGVSHGGGGRGF